MKIPHELMHTLGLEHTFDTKNTHFYLNCFQLVYAIEVFVGQKHTLLSF